MSEYKKSDGKVFVAKSGAWTMFAKVGGLYECKVYNAVGGLLDKVRCDDYRMALDYLRSFKKIAQACR